MDLTSSQAVVAAGGAALALALLHLLARRLRELPGIPERVVGSFSGGIAVAYVFLHLLPEIAEGDRTVGETLGDRLPVSPLVDLGIFLVALVGFLVFYALERLAEASAPEPRTGRGSALAFRVHLASFAVYNALLTYTMPLRFRTGVAFAVLFSVAMGLHFVLTDRGLDEHYGTRFDLRARLALAGSLLAGWLLAAVLAPTSTLVVALLTAFLGGSILLNVFKEELPSSRGSSLGWFAGSAAFYAALLAVVTGLAA